MGVRLERRGRPLEDIQDKARAFARDNQRIMKESAEIATGVSRDTFKRRSTSRPHVQDSPGRNRPTTMGNFRRLIHWMHERHDGIDLVQFQLARLEQDAPYWLIQEIGTGESGRILDDSMDDGFVYKGSHRSSGTGGGSGITSVKSQVGREISTYLAWGSASGRAPAPGKQGQLHYYRDVENAPFRDRAMVIGEEIQGKHYLRDGGRAGLANMSNNLMSLAQRTFQK